MFCLLIESKFPIDFIAWQTKKDFQQIILKAILSIIFRWWLHIIVSFICLLSDAMAKRILALLCNSQELYSKPSILPSMLYFLSWIDIRRLLDLFWTKTYFSKYIQFHIHMGNYFMLKNNGFHSSLIKILILNNEWLFFNFVLRNILPN